ncbi:hypothetical protein DQ04_00091270 [Trypanosoma grayi]|uniref:hypothetical protein n=1 Tax=Trypanosoma grayi TaxID=71804 RepID=UPI0004F4538A|nr:hypothetical protein DQ04_00091270 [Trypanosoma grayi]KEG15393.1 hypothetical protein DQ04_00091270 [Trypanosoma grayi]
MSQQNGAESPSPEGQTEVFSYRSSRAGSEAPQRAHDSAVHSPRSYRSSRAGSEAPTRLREDCSMHSSPAVTPRFSDGRGEYNDCRGAGAAGVYSSSRRVKQQHGDGANNMHATSTMAGGGKAAANTRMQRRAANTDEAAEMENALYHSVPHAGASFKLLQKLGYPFDPAESFKNEGNSESPDIHADSVEYEATGELHVVNSAEASDTRSVMRNDTEIIESSVSVMAMCMLPDPVHGTSALAVCVGDANGRVNYCELDMGHAKRFQSSMSISRKSKSNISTSSRSQTDLDLPSFANSVFSERSCLYSDGAGLYRPPIRKHSHQAYVREMDCLTSVTILQTVKSLRFLRSHESPNTINYLTSNERVIKLFRVPREGFLPFHAFPKMEAVLGRKLAHTRYFSPAAPPSLILPVRVFSGSHSSPVQDLSVCTDGQSFLSIDDLQVFWWNLEGGDASKGICIADCRPLSGRMDEVEELVTSAAFHPTHSSLFLVSRSSGLLGIGDLREAPSTSQRRYSTTIRVVNDAGLPSQEQYSDILCSISGADFLGPHHVVTRDYLSLKLWDLRRPDAPYSKAPVMSYVAPYLDPLYESDSIFDRFPVVVDHISGTVVTGLYDGAAAVWQPLSEGRIPSEDVMTHYRVDPQTLLCEVENGGRTTVETLSASLAQEWKTPAVRMPGEEAVPEEVPEPIANKVMCVSIADGGERFALTCKDGRCIFLFERAASSE